MGLHMELPQGGSCDDADGANDRTLGTLRLQPLDLFGVLLQLL